MLILTEKPSVAKDFAEALNCTSSTGFYRNSNTVIANCIGHLFKEEPPQHYSSEFPVIPEHWDYRLPDDEKLARHAKFIISLLKKHKNDTIIIATDADREGEVIARECLIQAEISDISNIKRFWVSQALTKDVILEGLKNAKPLSEYNQLAKKGFARQHADWLTGMNFCRYISNAAGTKLVVGRVQTAILSAIDERCEKIKNFVSRKYFEHYGVFRPTVAGAGSCKGIYFENDERGFSDDSRIPNLKACIGEKAKLIDSKTEKKTQNPPQLYNLNALQKDAFKYFGYSADKTLKILQSLYEELKCVSYPRTPSRVMGSGNVELCRKIADELCCSTLSHSHPKRDFKVIRMDMDISLSNRQCFNDTKLEAHHALIPLKDLETEELLNKSTPEQLNIYSLILDRFFEAFLPPCEYEKQTFTLDVNSSTFNVTGKKILKMGWKKYDCIDNPDNDSLHSVADNSHDEEQFLENINWNNLVLSNVETKEKWTKPPAYFNEASILSFMENPKADRQLTIQEEENLPQKKLVGLGTAATRHTFIPKLTKYGYITLEKKNIVTTEHGKMLLKSVRSSEIKSLADIAETTNWEEKLDENPAQFLSDIKTFIRNSVSKNITVSVPITSTSGIVCPVCGKDVRKGKSNWYCTGYKEGCKFLIWENIAGAKLTEKDVIALCNGKQTGIKHCTSKTGKSFDCRFAMDENKVVKFVFEEESL